MNIIEKVLELMQEDDANPAKQNQIIKSTYENANDLQKELIDECFIALCGYSLKNIIADKCE